MNRSGFTVESWIESARIQPELVFRSESFCTCYRRHTLYEGSSVAIIVRVVQYSRRVFRIVPNQITTSRFVPIIRG
jgi:hypothetical protein